MTGTRSLDRRSAILIIGMSGAGKSTALEALGSSGHRTVDTDDPGWIVEVGTDHGVDPCGISSGCPRCWTYIDRVGFFISGCEANQTALYDRFDAVVLLSAPVEVMLYRVVDRANPFGSDPQDRAQIASDVAKFEPRLRRRRARDRDDHAGGSGRRGTRTDSNLFCA